jgi:5S rRNA maturation endonuclease (ribonuclease M5)
MGDSNSDWGALAAHDSGAAEAWDSFTALPDPGENEALDAFCESKHITIDSLVRIGARLSDHTVLAFAGPGWLKFRDVVTGKRWSYADSDWSRMKIVKHGPEPSDKVILVEGESDLARLTSTYTCDVAALPAGAGFFPDTYAEQLSEYTIVLVGLDTDNAGEKGSAKILGALTNAMRFPPPANDWCEATSFPPLPTELDVPAPPAVIISAGELLDLEVPEIASWFEQELLPIGGLMILHGGYKSFKTFMTLDLLAALAQGRDWACFEPTEEACSVAVIQYELPWPYYRQRVQLLRATAPEPDLFDKHFGTFQPMRRPTLRAGNRKQEDFTLKSLVDAEVQVVLADPIRRMAGAIDMNSEQDVRKVLDFFERLNNEGITVVATHHDSKQSMRARGGDPLGMTGSGAFGGDPDSVVSVELPMGDDYRTSSRRNLSFMLRNGPAPMPRGFEISDEGHIMYSPTPFGDGLDDHEEGTPDHAPAI